MELLVASAVAGIVALAVVSMYVTALKAWDRAGAVLALQRNADLGLERIVSDVRRGSRVEIGSGHTSMRIYRTTATGDSLVAAYTLVGDEVRNQYDATVIDRVTSVRFTSGNGVKVRIEVDLMDDLGTPGLEGDDATLQMETVAVCRNRSLY